MSVRYDVKLIKVKKIELCEHLHLVDKTFPVLTYDIMADEYTIVDNDGKLIVLPAKNIEEVGM